MTTDDPGRRRAAQDGAQDDDTSQARKPGGTRPAADRTADRTAGDDPPDARTPAEAVDSAPSVSPDPDPEAAGISAPPTPPASPDRVFRSGAGIAGGVMLLALVAWLGFDALVRGQGRTPWLSLATMLLLVPLVSTFTLRPAVFANDERLRIRNPFRTITLPWAAVAAFRSGYSNEVIDQAGSKFQLWAVPVSLRARKKAGRAQQRAERGVAGRGRGLLGGQRSRSVSGAFGGQGRSQDGRSPDPDSLRAPTDRTMDDLRELHGNQAEVSAAQGDTEVRWCYEIIAPALAGLVLLVVLLGVG